MTLTPAEKRLARAVGFDEVVCQLIKQQCREPLKRLKVFTDEMDVAETNALVVAASRDKAISTVSKLQPKVTPFGYRVFWSEAIDKNGRSQSDGIAALKTTDESEIIRLMRTSGGNYDVSTDDILRRIQKWRSECELEVVGAGGAWVAIRFATLPDRICSFAEEIYDFCPDTVDQGVGLLNEADYREMFEAARRLCPKLSKKMEQTLKARKTRIEAMEVPPQIRAMIESSSFTTPTDMGIRLLAYQLEESAELYLWWD